MPARTQLARVTPTLAGLAVARTGSAKMIGRYCPERDVWVVDCEGAARPIIELGGDLAGTTTMTKVRAERDDTDASPLLEAGTRTATAVAAEADDQDRDRIAAALLMATTKTEVRQERDDVAKIEPEFEPQSWAGRLAGGIPIH